MHDFFTGFQQRGGDISAKSDGLMNGSIRPCDRDHELEIILTKKAILINRGFCPDLEKNTRKAR